VRANNILSVLMKNRSISGGQLAESTGLNNSVISQIKNGIRLPSDEELEKICIALGVTPEQIYPDDQLREALQEAR